MAKAANVCTILAFLLAIPVAYKTLNPTGTLPSLPPHWPLILLCVAFGGGAILQVIAAILNRQNPKTPTKNAEVNELKNELKKVYGDCIYDWVVTTQQNAPFGADQLAHHLNLSREKIDAGIAYLNSMHVLERAGFEWKIDPCRPLNPDFKRAPQWNVG